MAESKCLFCGIISGSVPSLKVYEGKNVIAVLSIKPASKGHLLVIPKEHQAYLHMLSGEALFEIMSAIRSLTVLLSQSFKPTGFNIINNIGTGAGQKIPHAVFEIIPRYANDNIKLEIPQGATNEDELINTQKKILESSRSNTIASLKAITEGKVKSSPEVKAEAEKILAQIKEQENPLSATKTQYSKKLDNLLNEEKK